MADAVRDDTARNDVWVQASGYEFYVGRWSRPVADKFLHWIDVPPRQAWLDVGCGTGALCDRIRDHCEPARLVGVDRSEGFLSHAGAHVTRSRVEFRRADAQALPFANHSFDVVVSGLMLNFVPAPAQVVAEMRRVTRPGGKIAAYVWDYAEGMQMMRYFWDAAVALDPAARELDESRRFPLCRPEPLRALFTDMGLRAVDVTAIDIPTVFMNFDDYWSPFCGGQGPAPGYCVSLPIEAHNALRERLRQTLPIDRDGKIHLTARAWAVQGIV